jgi:hypothetical protein
MEEHERKWRLVLGSETNEQFGSGLSGIELNIDKTLEALYNQGERRGGLGPSSPNVSRWLGDIREYFPTSVVKVMQQDALQNRRCWNLLFRMYTLWQILCRSEK